ncbi:UDP-2,4-diacetamido-2,4,6-trideoxy-beta-L-altropyranose hydrolase [Moritella sp. 36]|uniref:UDP-2,4-diacetamido-2,4, 6-trideoxy-beta-L-altropyranose hydrolase n=1 Tax=Moritella sp. 36 TaxID=2746233 RepID=UPI001BA4D79F|nr:UDP-2,4-diacetamido-2,4,6-trideoxy-beta-L-altropyranose hydrolase [Moritella sp. 36]QUM87914.1 UDP-2,4-diacetamido-2,4,6-trideoxy-beta-L-altropyranose hydrolase [Moritella sp. 36]
MKIVIRTDASIHIGSGHVMRCLVLAQALVLQGHKVSFACRPQAGDLIQFVRNKGFHVDELIQAQTLIEPRNSGDYQAWLQVPWLDDAQSLCKQVCNADLLIVDHYALNQEWQTWVKQRLGCKVFVIDDLVRTHDADLILDQTLMRVVDEYQENNQSAKILTGCEFALLNPFFSRYREQALDNDLLPAEPKVLISMGGIDQPNATLKVLEALALHPLPKPCVTVLLGPKAPNYEQVKAFCVENQDWIQHIDFVENMAELMLEHSIAIGAPGTTSWERACLGIPSIIVPLAENQNTISQNLVACEAAIRVNITALSSELLSAYLTLLTKWNSFRGTNLALCDGLGLQRVLHHIQMLFDNDLASLEIRRASSSDIEKVYEWQCLSETRKYALNSAVPTWNEHQSWMKKKLTCYQDYFYLLECPLEQARVGVVRLDRIRPGEYLVSIFIDPAFYSKGIAKRALAYIDCIHPNITIHATVLEANLASQKLFTSASYQRLSRDTFIRPPLF